MDSNQVLTLALIGGVAYLVYTNMGDYSRNYTHHRHNHNTLLQQEAMLQLACHQRPQACWAYRQKFNNTDMSGATEDDGRHNY